jgi:hypothetical protein
VTYQAVAFQQIAVRGRREALHAGGEVLCPHTRLHHIERREVLRVAVEVLRLRQPPRRHGVEGECAREAGLHQRVALGCTMSDFAATDFPLPI